MSYYVSLPDCSQHTIFPGVNIFTCAGEKMMLSLVEFQPRAVVEPHSHPNVQMGMLLQRELTFTLGGQSTALRAAEMGRIPGGVVHSAVAGDAPVNALDVYHPIREDYR